jgi:hypothetical protein
MNDKEKIEKALSLIEEMLLVVAEKDKEHKKEAIHAGQGERAVGESWEVFYLNMVSKILKGEEL